eukprot:GILK01008106.1.p1 GENE.GILK01008106.1~~GILK01008106.1.p1  ORF type:complete len:550 (-),score=26.05 GILK01008106.1:163-1587(-)
MKHWALNELLCKGYLMKQRDSPMARAVRVRKHPKFGCQRAKRHGDVSDRVSTLLTDVSRFTLGGQSFASLFLDENHAHEVCDVSILCKGELSNEQFPWPLLDLAAYFVLEKKVSSKMIVMCLRVLSGPLQCRVYLSIYFSLNSSPSTLRSPDRDSVSSSESATSMFLEDFDRAEQVLRLQQRIWHHLIGYCEVYKEMITNANLTWQARVEIVDLLYNIPLHALGGDFMTFLIEFVRGSSEKNVLTAGLLSYLAREASRDCDVIELLLLHMNDPVVLTSPEINFRIAVFSPFWLLTALGLRSQSIEICRAYLRLTQELVSEGTHFHRIRRQLFDRLVSFGVDGAAVIFEFFNLFFETCSMYVDISHFYFAVRAAEMKPIEPSSSRSSRWLSPVVYLMFRAIIRHPQYVRLHGMLVAKRLISQDTDLEALVRLEDNWRRRRLVLLGLRQPGRHCSALASQLVSLGEGVLRNIFRFI